MPTPLDDAMDMPGDSRLIIKKLAPERSPGETYRWVLARYHAASVSLVIIDQFLTQADAIAEVDNIAHLEQEGRI